jgi:AbrB family looped-hinge helix DNA binding protein
MRLPPFRHAENIVRKSKIEGFVKILAESTLTSKGQLTVPKVVRQLLDLHAGDSLVWSLDAEGRLIVSGGRTNTLEDIRAAVAAAEKTQGKPKTLADVTIKDVKAGIAHAVRSKHGRR